MKRIALIFSVVLCCFAALSAEPNLSQDQIDRIFNAKVKMMQDQLDLSPAQTERFIPVYRSYCNEVRNLFHSHPRPDKRAATVSSDAACRFVLGNLKTKETVLRIQQKYIPKLSKILSPQQLLMFLKVESDIQHQIMGEHSRRNGGNHMRNR
jgi:hypothetical protein